MAPAAAEFTLFPRLPQELRRAIWQQCRPHRVMEIDAPTKDFVDTYCQLKHTAFLNTRHPIITRVCRESRDVAFENAGVIGEDDNPDAPGWLNNIQNRWFSPSTDIVHLNWYLDYNTDFPTAGNPIPFFLEKAAKGVAASITADLVHSFDSPPHVWGIDEDFDLLEHRKDYLVTLTMVNLHVSADQAAQSGLFGRLAEERVKLVDPTDKETIQKYHQLWLLGPAEDQEPAKFFELALSTRRFLERIEKWSDELDTKWLQHKWHAARDVEEPEKVWLEPRRDQNREPIDVLILWGSPTPRPNPNKHHPWVRKTLKDMPQFSPMIMFRLCELECYKPMPPPPPWPPKEVELKAEVETSLEFPGVDDFRIQADIERDYYLP